jgi:hypothetical protein
MENRYFGWLWHLRSKEKSLGQCECSEMVRREKKSYLCEGQISEYRCVKNVSSSFPQAYLHFLGKR